MSSSPAVRHLRRVITSLVSVASLGVLASCGSDSSTMALPAITYSMDMNGLNVRPEYIVGPAVGTGTVVKKGNTLTYAVRVTGALTSAIISAHIHVGGAESTGDAVADLDRTGAQSGLVLSGTIDLTTFDGRAGAAVNGDSLMVLLDSGNAYADIHTVDQADGELRSQIIRIE